MEWLLGNPEEFAKFVYEGDIDKYVIENISDINKKIIIKNAINKINNKEYFSAFNEDLYYDLRYNYKAENSLQRVWNKANHLVTTGKHIRSDEFNLVFLDNEIHLEFVDYYFRQVPDLLFYTYNIVIELYDKFIQEIPETTRLYNNWLIVYKLTDLFNPANPEEYFDKETRDLLSFVCEDCEKIVKVDLSSNEFDGFRYGWGFPCPKCKNDISICKYIFLEDYEDNKSNLKL